MFRNSSEELSQLTPPKQEESTGKFFGSIATAASQRVLPPPRCQSSSRPRWRWQTLTCRRPALHYRNLLLFLAPTPGHSSLLKPICYWNHETNCRPNAFKSPERRTREDSVFFVFNSAIRSCDALRRCSDGLEPRTSPQAKGMLPLKPEENRWRRASFTIGTSYG